MSYSQSTFLSNARSGATTTADYTKNINRSNVRSDLATYTSNLVTWLKANEFDSSTDDILGGKTPLCLSNRQKKHVIAVPLAHELAFKKSRLVRKTTIYFTPWRVLCRQGVYCLVGCSGGKCGSKKICHKA